MNDAATLDAYGTLIEPTTLKIQRLLPGPIERVWAYRAHLVLPHRQRAAPQMAGIRRYAGQGGRLLRAGLAQ